MGMYIISPSKIVCAMIWKLMVYSFINKCSNLNLTEIIDI